MSTWMYLFARILCGAKDNSFRKSKVPVQKSIKFPKGRSTIYSFFKRIYLYRWALRNGLLRNWNNPYASCKSSTVFYLSSFFIRRWKWVNKRMIFVYIGNWMENYIFEIMNFLPKWGSQLVLSNFYWCLCNLYSKKDETKKKQAKKKDEDDIKNV